MKTNSVIHILRRAASVVLAVLALGVGNRLVATDCVSLPDPLPLPYSTGNTLTAPSGMNGYSWQIVSVTGAGWGITGGANSATVVYTAGSSGTATFRVSLTGASGCVDTCDVTVGLNPVRLAFYKSADKAWVSAGGTATYLYTVVNQGTVALSNVTVTDDNGTPGFPDDDFVVGTIPSLGAGLSQSFTVTKALPQTMCMTVGGTNLNVGTMTTEKLANGDIKVVFRQSLDLVDNTYGNKASADWPNGHTWANFTGSDKAQFVFYDSKGNKVLDFDADYVSAGAFPSGYGCLGLGGDGGLNSGSAANIVSINTTLAKNLNQSAAYYGYIVNSPTLPDPNWDLVDGYEVVVKAATFGANGFGSVSIPLVHNSPSKLGFNASTPTPCGGCVVNTAVVSATYGGDTFTASATAQVCVGTQPSVGDRVWNDLNHNGAQDLGEPGIAGVTVRLYKSSDNSLVDTTVTDAYGAYGFSAAAGQYYLSFLPPAGYVFSSNGKVNPATGMTAAFTVVAGQSDLTWDAGVYAVPGLAISVTPSGPVVSSSQPVIFSYAVQNQGTTTINNIIVMDNNGTPGVPADDVVVGTIASLAPGQTQTLTRTITLPQTLCMTVSGTNLNVGTMTTEKLANGDIKVTFRQSLNLVDNTYGNKASADWPNGHTWANFTGSDKAQFVFYDSKGNKVLDFDADYVSAGAFPSGYGCLGLGGDGGLNSGSAANIVSINTTLAKNLNQSAAYYGYIVNSPTMPDPNWDLVDGYEVVVKAATFGANGFGSVSIPLVHNSPSKLGFNASTPTPCSGCYSNMASASGVNTSGQAVAATGSAQVCLSSGQPAALGDFVWQDLNANGIQDAGEPGIPGVAVELYDCSSGVRVQSATTSASGYYLFNVLPGSYAVKFLPPYGYNFSPQTQGANTAKDSNPDPATGWAACVTLSAGQTNLTIDAGLYRVGSGLSIEKLATPETVAAGGIATYYYIVRNQGSTTLHNISVADDNGTPLDPTDDFIVGTIATLGVGQSQVFSATRTLPQTLCMTTAAGTNLTVGTLTTETLANGDIKVTFRQSLNLVDNTYGATASADWPSGHTFGNFTGSDKAQFVFYDSKGNKVLDFDADYISAGAFPSGYGCLGLGGDGGLNSGSAANIVSINTTLAKNLNQSPAYYGYIVNSPNLPDPNWDLADGYEVVVKASTFGANGFGRVAIPLIHNSPSKLGFNAATPTNQCNSCVTNLAWGAGTDDCGRVVLAQASATVCSSSAPPVCAACVLGYPYTSAYPRTSVVFNESEVLRAYTTNVAVAGDTIKVWYNDEHALSLGVRRVIVKTAGGTTTTDYPFTSLSSNPGSAINPLVGTTASSGDQAGTDLADRPIYPALFITDTTADPNSRAGDWQYGGTPIPPSAVYGTWKGVVRTVDKTKSPAVVTVTPDADPAKNDWNLGTGNPPPAGLVNQGFGAEVTWNVNDLGLLPGHSYRLQFMVHDGDQNKSGGDVGEACTTICSIQGTPLSLGNRVFLDNGIGGGGANDGIQNGTEPGISNVVVRLFAADGSGNPIGSVLDTQVTDTTGFYRFDDLSAGTYVPVVDVTASGTALTGVVSSTGNSTLTTLLGDLKDHGKDTPLGAASVLPGGIASVPVTLGPSLQPLNEAVSGTGAGAHGPSGDANDNLVMDFGFTPIYSVGNRVWWDNGGAPGSGGVANDGKQQASELGAANVTLQLKNSSGTVLGTTVTDVNGYYRFDGILPGMNYTVTIPASNFQVGGVLHNYTVSPVVVGGDQGNKGIATPNPWLAYLVGTTSGAFNLGLGLQPSNEPDLGGTSPNPPLNHGPAGDTNDNLTIDFGIDPAYSIGNRVFLDIGTPNAGGTRDGANNGIQDGTEPGIADVTLKLFAANGSGQPTGSVLATQNTDTNGYYRFDGLGAGTYVVVVDRNASVSLATFKSSDPTSADMTITGDTNDHGINTPLAAGSVLQGGIASAPVTVGLGLQPQTEIVSNTPGQGSHGPFGDSYDNLVVDFGFCPPGGPTLSTVASFTARWDVDRVKVAWTSVAEFWTLGYNVYAQQADGTRRPVNAAWIPGSGNPLGSSYAVEDTTVRPPATISYWLEEMDNTLTPTWFGPVAVVVPAPAVTAGARMTEAGFELTFTGQVGVDYEVQVTEDLAGGVWETLTTASPAADGQFTVADPSALGQPMRFYRAVSR